VIILAFPEKLKALRLKYKLTQEELGEKLCWSRTSISYYEQGKFEPDIKTIIDISNLFNVTTDELLK
jgi:transcriptional regulator with XRE-family HTH domain